MIACFFSINILAHYEFFLTSGLIVPPPFTELTSLNEFVEHKFTFVDWDRTAFGLMPTHEIMEPEFIQRHLDPKLFNSSSLRISENQDLWKQVSRSQRKHCILVKGMTPVHLRHVQNKLLRGEFKCYVTKNAADNKFNWGIFVFVVSSKAKAAMDNLMENGIFSHWKKW